MISLDSVRFTYEDAESPALDGISFTAAAGSFVCIAGAESSGRSTLFRLLNGTAPNSFPGTVSGSIRIGDFDPSESGHHVTGTLVTSVFDDPDSQIISLTVEEEVSFALVQRGYRFEEIGERVSTALSRVGLAGFERRSTGSLSGGQKQRLIMASAIALRPKILLADEGTSALDPAGARLYFQIIEEMRVHDGTLAVVIDRDLGLILEHADQVIILDHGKMLLSGTPKEVCQYPDLLASAGLRLPAWLELSALLKRRGVLRGAIPSNEAEAHSVLASLVPEQVSA